MTNTEKHYAHARPISACLRCRKGKVRCDRTKPQCERCIRVGVQCMYTPADDSQDIRHDDRDGHNQLSSGRDLDNQQARDQEHGEKNTTPAAEERPLSHLDAPLRRNRAIISCVRCRKHKVRCDRNIPCSRCARLMKGSECIYLQGNGASSGSTLADSTKDIAVTFEDKQWNQRFRTRAHWGTLHREIQEYLMAGGRRPFLHDFRPGKSRPCISLSINYPFCDGSGNGKSTESVLHQLPPKAMQQELVSLYMETVEEAYHFLNRTTFEAELEEFWSDGKTPGEDWLAQFLLVLSLGCLCRNFITEEDNGDDGTEEIYHTLPSRFVNDAQVCLRKTPFMLRPTLANIRTLCLTVLVKQIYGMSCHESDTCWPLMGTIVRLSIGRGLHLSADAEGRRLWATILYLDMRQSLMCGMPLLLPPGGISTLSHGKNMETPTLGCGEGRDVRTSAIEQIILGSTGAVLLRAIELATSADESVSYQQVMEVEALLRNYLQRPVVNFNAPHLHPVETGASPHHDLESCTLDIFLRQTLLALTSRFALLTYSSNLYPACHISSLESALAILSYQRTLHEIDHTPSAWFAGLFRFDFFTAAMTLCCQLVRDDSALDVAIGGEMAPRGMVVEALRSCRELWRGEGAFSVCNARAFGIIDEILGLLE